MNEKKIFDDLNFYGKSQILESSKCKCVCSHCEIDKEEMVVKKKRMVMM